MTENCLVTWVWVIKLITVTSDGTLTGPDRITKYVVSTQQHEVPVLQNRLKSVHKSMDLGVFIGLGTFLQQLIPTINITQPL